MIVADFESFTPAPLDESKEKGVQIRRWTKTADGTSTEIRDDGALTENIQRQKQDKTPFIMQ